MFFFNCHSTCLFLHEFNYTEVCKRSMVSAQDEKETKAVSYLLQPLRVVLHCALQVLQFLSRPFTVDWRRVSLHDTRPAARAGVLFGLWQRSSALAHIQLRQDEGVAALAMLDAVKLPPLLHTSFSTTSSSSLASSSSSSFCACNSGCISDDWQGAKQQNHLQPSDEIEAFHDALFNYTEVFSLRVKRVKRSAFTLWPQFTLWKHLWAGCNTSQARVSASQTMRSDSTSPFSLFCWTSGDNFGRQKQKATPVLWSHIESSSLAPKMCIRWVSQCMGWIRFFLLFFGLNFLLCGHDLSCWWRFSGWMHWLDPGQVSHNFLEIPSCL